MQDNRSFKKILALIGLDFALIVVLFLVSTLISALISMSNDDCLTCGAGIALTFLAASVFALQPVIWVRGLRFHIRFLIWVAAVAFGFIIYLAVQYATLLYMSSSDKNLADVLFFLISGGSIMIFLSWIISTEVAVYLLIRKFSEKKITY